MCLSALLIFIYSLKISEWCSPDGWEVRRTCGDRLEIGERQRIFYFRIFLNLFAVSDSLLLHIPAALRNSFVW